MSTELETRVLRKAVEKLTAAKNFVRAHSCRDCSMEQEARLWRTVSKMLVPENFSDGVGPRETEVLEVVK